MSIRKNKLFLVAIKRATEEERTVMNVTDLVATLREINLDDSITGFNCEKVNVSAHVNRILDNLREGATVKNKNDENHFFIAVYTNLWELLQHNASFVPDMNVLTDAVCSYIKSGAYCCTNSLLSSFVTRDLIDSCVGYWSFYNEK